MANWASQRGNPLTRPVLESALGVHRDAALPRFHVNDFVTRAKAEILTVNTEAPGFGRKAVLYATCFVNYNNPGIGRAARQVLAHNGIETEVTFPSCCGMPQLEHGDIARAAGQARVIASELRPWVDEGWDVIAPIPSCALMLKFEWPLILPDIELTVIQRCSGHGGSWGIMKENFETAIKVGKPVARQARRAATTYVASGCPLAGEHIVQGMERVEGERSCAERSNHPVEILAAAYGF